MGQISKLRVHNYKSIGEPVEIRFPDRVPVILVGENNVGKSNIVRAVELVLGESWPGNYEPEDHDYHKRDKSNVPMEISVDVTDVVVEQRGRKLAVNRFLWTYPPSERRSCLSMVMSDGSVNSFVSNESREQCVCIVVGADRRLAYQLSYASKYTFLSKLMRRFHDELTSDHDRVEHLQDKFGEIKSTFEEVEAFSVFAKELSSQVKELSGNLEYGLQVDFSAYDPSNFFHALRVHPFTGDHALTFEEIGTGQEQILALSFAWAYAKAFHGKTGGITLVIEEPEVHLHPLAQRWLGQKVHGFAEQGVQVLLTTHSPAFIDMLHLDGVVLLRKRDDATEVMQLSRDELADFCGEHGAMKTNAESILPFYAAVATEEILSGFFARKVVLVEGPSEALALPIYMSRVGLMVSAEGIAIIPVHGVGNLSKWWRLFSAYKIPVFVAFDNDTRDDTKADKRKDILRTLSVPEKRDDEILQAKSFVIGDNFTVFGVDFETTLRGNFEDYGKLETEAKDSFSLSAEHSKPLIAKYVAERLSYSKQTSGWSAFRALADKIRHLDMIEEENIPF